MASSITGNYAGMASTLLSKDGALGRFMPEPKSRIGSTFQRLLKGAGSVLSTQGSAFIGIDPQYQELLTKQMEVQQQLQLVSMHSNVEKSKHESKMSAIRNMRAA